MKELDCLRKSIDDLDETIVSLIENRLSLSKEISLIKKKYGYLTYDKKREEEVLRRVVNLLKDRDFEANIVNIYNSIMDESKKVQNRRK